VNHHAPDGTVVSFQRYLFVGLAGWGVALMKVNLNL